MLGLAGMENGWIGCQFYFLKLLFACLLSCLCMCFVCWMYFFPGKTNWQIQSCITLFGRSTLLQIFIGSFFSFHFYLLFAMYTIQFKTDRHEVNTASIRRANIQSNVQSSINLLNLLFSVKYKSNLFGSSF